MTKKEKKEKAEEILSEMSPREKLGQVTGMYTMASIPTDMYRRFKDGIGELCFMPGTASAEENAARSEEEWKTMKEICGIPAIRHNEALTGQMTHDSTVFPSAIGLGATFDPEAVKEMADVIRRQMAAEGTRQALSPVMDVARDPRWGRMGETYGEDPTLCAAMSVAFTKGLQTDDLSQGVMATGKHFLGYAFSEGGLNMASNPITERELREVYAKPFQAAITEGHLASIMNSYGTVDRELIIDSEKILTKLLCEEMGFDGLVVSDYMSVNKIVDLGLTSAPEEAGAQALKAGLDVELPLPYGFTEKILSYIEKDEAAQKALDRAARRVIEAKLELGIMDAPPAKKEWLASAYDRAATEPVSRKLARESIVLLKNEGVLPLSKKTRRIALIGPHADSIRLLFGCYTYAAAFDRDTSGSMNDMPGMQNIAPKEASPYQMPYMEGSTVRGTAPYIEEELRKRYGETTPTILEAVREKCEGEIRYAKGYEVAGEDRSGFEEALETVRWADAVIAVCGGKYGWGSSCTTGEGVDCDNIGVTGVQEELLLEIAESGRPCVLVHMDAKPLSSEKLTEKYGAVLENWYPGDTGGTALAEVLFGEVNPGGRLPVTAPRSTGQIPIYASQLRGSGYRPGNGMTIAKYVENEKTPLYCFGHGLSYTEFSYSDLSCTAEISAGEAAEIRCRVTNTGKLKGEEVVQLYISDMQASMIRPEQELAGFARVSLEPGESTEVCFRVRADQFAFLDKDFNWIVEKGKMEIRIGASSMDIRLRGEFTVTDTKIIDGKTRGFYAETWNEKTGM